MLDDEGFITEATTANVLVVNQQGLLISPPKEKILPGISLSMLLELATNLNIPLANQNLLPPDLSAAAEVLLCSTSPCILPVTKFNGRPVGDGRPGSIYRKLLNAWSDRVGVRIDQQALALQHQ
jgi:branched-subunit amino acid aminotransferase/4-amino-4-deoxychorismate lyase